MPWELIFEFLFRFLERCYPPPTSDASDEEFSRCQDDRCQWIRDHEGTPVLRWHVWRAVRASGVRGRKNVQEAVEETLRRISETSDVELATMVRPLKEVE